MVRNEKIKMRLNIEKVINSTSAIPNKEILLSSLKGYSKYTKDIEKEIYDNPEKNSWAILGKLALNYEIFQNMGEKKKSFNNQNSFFKNENLFLVVHDPKDVKKFKEGLSSTEKVPLDENLEIEKENFLNSFFKNNSKLAIEPEIKKILSDYFLATKKNLLEKALSYVIVLNHLTKLKVLKGDINKALGLDSKGANYLEFRSELYLKFKSNKEIVEYLKLIKDSTIGKIKKCKTDDEIKNYILLGKVNG